MISWLTLLLLLRLVSTLPLERRSANTACGQFDTISSGPYSLLTNLWGESSAASGQQCATLRSIHGNTVSWSTQWDWVGDSSIKSFSNMQLNVGIGRQLGAITKMPSTWQWSQHDSEGAVCDVAYDLFTTDTPGGSGPNLNEVMIWLAKFNTQPISYEYNYDGEAVAVETSIRIAGYSWTLARGSNGNNPVYSFLPERPITSFSGDIHEFFKYLMDAQYISSEEYLKTAQAGTEATSGRATFVTSAYSLTIN